MAGRGAGVLRAGHLWDFVLCDFEVDNTLRQVIYIRQNVFIKKKIQCYSKYVHECKFLTNIESKTIYIELL